MAKGWADFSAITRAFRNRNFAIYTTGNIFSHTGLWVQRLAVGWMAWSLTESAFWVGAVAFADLFPVILLGPFGGVMADRLRRLRVVLACQVLSSLQAVALFLLTAYDMIAIGWLFALVLVQGVIGGINQPARQSLIPSLVREEDLTSAVAINSVIFNVARFIGPAIAGVVIAGYGLAPAFAINAASYLFVIVALLFISIPRRDRRLAGRRTVIGDLLLGLRYTRRHAIIGPLILWSFALSLLVRPVNELLPAATELLFERGAGGLAILTAARGVGALWAGLLLAKSTDVERLPRNVVGSMLLAVISVALLLGGGNFWIGVAALVLFGYAMTRTGVGTMTLIQVTVDNRLRGRVLSLNGLIMRGLPALGGITMGWIADRAGLYWPLAVGAGLCFVIYLVAARWERGIRPTTAPAKAVPTDD